MDAPAQATLTAAANMQALEDWIAQCQRLDEIVAAGLMNRREASAWKVANKPRPPGMALPKAARAAASSTSRQEEDGGEVAPKPDPKPWPCSDDAACAVAESYSTFEIGRHSIAAAYREGTLFEGVTQEHATSRAKKDAGSGAPGRGYYDWEFLKDEQVYSCRLASDTSLILMRYHTDTSN